MSLDYKDFRKACEEAARAFRHPAISGAASVEVAEQDDGGFRVTVRVTFPGMTPLHQGMSELVPEAEATDDKASEIVNRLAGKIISDRQS